MTKPTSTSRLAAAFGALFMSIATAALAAEYAYPEAAPQQIASIKR